MKLQEHIIPNAKTADIADAALHDVMYDSEFLQGVVLWHLTLP